jgi:hypothetical protein
MTMIPNNPTGHQPLEHQLRAVHEALLWKASELYEIDAAIAAREESLRGLRAHRAQVLTETDALQQRQAHLTRMRGMVAPAARPPAHSKQEN